MTQKIVKFDLGIIIAMYNSEKTIQGCLESIISADNYSSSILIVVVNDGCNDSSLQLVKPYESDNIKVLSKANGGLSSARNHGLDYALKDCRYVSFVDSDDTVSNEYFSEFYLATFNFPDIVEFNIGKYFNSGVQESEVIESSFSNDALNNEIDYFKLIQRNAWYAVSRFYKATIIKNNRFAEGRRYEDMILIPSLYKVAKNVYSSSKPLYNYFISTGGITQNVRPSDITDVIYAFDIFKSHYCDKKECEQMMRNIKLQIIVFLGYLNFSEYLAVRNALVSFFDSNKFILNLLYFLSRFKVILTKKNKV